MHEHSFGTTNSNVGLDLHNLMLLNVRETHLCESCLLLNLLAVTFLTREFFLKLGEFPLLAAKVL